MSDTKVVVNRREFKVSRSEGNIFIDGKLFEADRIEFRKGHFQILRNHQSYKAEIVEHRPEEKSLIIKVNTNTYSLKLSDRYDELLQAMGMDASSQKVINDVKAPMPGLVLKVMIEPGQSISKGDTLLILEAMKMENILKVFRCLYCLSRLLTRKTAEKKVFLLRSAHSFTGHQLTKNYCFRNQHLAGQFCVIELNWGRRGTRKKAGL